VALVTIPTPAASVDAATASAHCRSLESGDLLLLAETPLAWTAQDRAVLLACDRAAAAHKNIAYRLADDRLIGAGRGQDEPGARLRHVLRLYAEQISALLARLLTPYAASWRIDVTSFRPQEEEGRQLPFRARNDLLHIDAFPSRPTNGDRILRVFTNVHPTRARCWVTAAPFERLIGDFAGRPGAPLALPRRHTPWRSLRRRLARHAPAAAAPLLRRSPYDGFMLRFHDHLKADLRFQAATPRQTWEFPPGSSWIVFTDCLPHAALSGQFALEQTFMVPRAALLRPESAPVSILERLCGASLTDP
jgi:hypothetical protein